MVQIDRGVRGGGQWPLLPPLIGHSEESCTECWGCVRHCPARALRVAEGRTEIIDERCVKCGTCVTECGNASHPVRNDTPRVVELLQSGTPVVILLASEYIAAMHPMTPQEVEDALLDMGFSGVETTVLGEEIVAAAYEQVHLNNPSALPRIRSTCPVTVEWVRRFHPQLTGALVPVVPPYIAHARLVRELYTGGVSIVYVSPCWSRKDEVYSPEFAGDVEVAIGFDELRDLLTGASPVASGSAGLRRPRATKEISVTDGFPRRTLSESNHTDRDIVTVRGLPDLDRLLSAISRGETCPTVVDTLNCEGCIDGPCVNRELSVFAKRNIDLAERESQAAPAVDSRTFLAAIPAVELKRVFTPNPAPMREPSAEEIDRVLFAGEFASRAETVDCGACGYATCVHHAAAICLGNSTWDMCFPLAKKRLVRDRERLEAASVTDDLTGLFNRRAFDARLVEEVGRAERYDVPLSLVMLDLDGFKGINDHFGHLAGDALLRSVGVLLRALLRGTDIPVRYGGDEFAVILPGTPKTDAWAVAEKIRASLADLTAQTDDGKTVGTTVSVGVASYCEEHAEPTTLLHAADAALYHAKRSGRDRVEIAAG